jgi:hypothetical protein
MKYRRKDWVVICAALLVYGVCLCGLVGMVIVETVSK